MPLLGVEKIGWKPGCELQEESTPYNEQKGHRFLYRPSYTHNKNPTGIVRNYFPKESHPAPPLKEKCPQRHCKSSEKEGRGPPKVFQPNFLGNFDKIPFNQGR